MDEKEVNDLLNLRGKNGELIDIFRLYGVLFIGNTEGGEWNVSKSFNMHAAHGISLDIEDFEDCTTKEEVDDTFAEALKAAVMERLV